MNPSVEIPTGSLKARPEDHLRSPVEQRLVFHARLVETDREHSDEIAGDLLPRLIRRTAARFPHADPDQVFDAVVDALMGYLADPTTFDLSRGVPLAGFLA